MRLPAHRRPACHRLVNHSQRWAQYSTSAQISFTRYVMAAIVAGSRCQLKMPRPDAYPARTGRPTSKLRCSAYSGRSTAGYEQRTRPNPGIWLARLVALKQSLARLSFRTVRLAGERQKQDRSRLGRGGAAHRVSATLSESWSTLRRWPPASVMTGERPAKAEAALHDLTVAKSKRVRPPQNRRMSALRAFETTMPGGVCARAAGLTAPQRLRQST